METINNDTNIKKTKTKRAKQSTKELSDSLDQGIINHNTETGEHEIIINKGDYKLDIENIENIENDNLVTIQEIKKKTRKCNASKKQPFLKNNNIEVLINIKNNLLKSLSDIDDLINNFNPPNNLNLCL